MMPLMKKTITTVELIDDIDGQVGARTIPFAFDGSEFEIELAPKNEEKFRKAMAPFMASARRTKKARRPKASVNAPSPSKIRAWANSNGYEVSARGLIPKAVTQAYAEAHHMALETL